MDFRSGENLLECKHKRRCLLTGYIHVYVTKSFWLSWIIRIVMVDRKTRLSLCGKKVRSEKGMGEKQKKSGGREREREGECFLIHCAEGKVFLKF